VSGNSHPFFGGGGISNFGVLSVSDCTISGNSADLGGGGIFNGHFGVLSVSDCTITDNRSADIHGGGGGGILNAAECTATISGCILSGNTAVLNGGAIYNAGALTVRDSTMFGNSAQNGGGVYNAAIGTMTVSGDALSDNSAVVQGGGVYNAGALTVLDSIFNGNIPDDIYGPYTDGGGNSFS
jgi:predicted outer membrane repeat protein